MSNLNQVLEQRNIRTATALKGKWSDNARENRSQIRLQTSRLWLDENDRTGVLIAAGPSLSESISEIHSFCADSKTRSAHEIVAVDMALSYLLKNNVVPDFVICSDASSEIVRTLDFKGIPDNLPLLLNVIANPEVSRIWKGPIYWFGMNSNFYDGDLGKWMQDDHKAVSGVTSFLIPGGNVSTLGVSFLSGVRSSQKILLYGHDFCWPDKGDFYCGGVRRDMADKRIKAEAESGTVLDMTDTMGRPVKSNGSLLTFAKWYAEQDRMRPGLLENRTPRTILQLGGK